MSVFSELIYAGCGLHANATNPKFAAGPECAAKWAILMLAAAKEISDLQDQVISANTASAQLL